ncbi:MAG: ABC transporter permease, partial [Burkholderiaceae bacterium]|nr:ABC transporter permease [Burkholderiaceae bacterium]
MSRYLVRRCLTLVLTLIATSVIVFAALNALPGNAAQALMGPDADPVAVAAKAHQLGLDRPAPLRYAAWIAGLLHGDMGQSYAYSSPVAGLIAQRLTLTVPLALLAMGLAAALALAAGVYAAARHRRAGDWGVMLLAQLGIAIPNFWLAILLILLF